MPQKICVISFDHWNYDYHIATTLNSLGHEATHIKIGNYKHKNLKDQVINSFSKVILKKNLKKIKRQDYIIECLNTLGPQDQILVINPEVIDLKHHAKIKKHTKRYIAYLYDSVARNPIEHLLDGLFDSIFSFDKNDINHYGFNHISNYNYLEKITSKIKPSFDVVYLGSFDERLLKLIPIIEFLKAQKISFKCIIVGKNKALNYIKEEYGHVIEFTQNSLSQEQLINFYRSGETIIDLIRDEQTGLSFRFFEAMAIQKKIITNNSNCKNYDFYDSNNIVVIDKKIDIKKTFFKSNYKAIPKNIYYKYTLENWVKKVFNL
ncbi:hypothetical protein JAO71_07435 [Olleya sp. YSTF-M6]|uniref:Glycosyltransferase n=1 Tax=Olleya sediminilitoris TaxID=2795739 RepID=A0ABS1WKI8_9FLAO|nr:hypothetical protein [Olleya sediminilitoris]MBL7559632.1 hypothetical protein [Olleya sediminilitoris]